MRLRESSSIPLRREADESEEEDYDDYDCETWEYEKILREHLDTYFQGSLVSFFPCQP